MYLLLDFLSDFFLVSSFDAEKYFHHNLTIESNYHHFAQRTWVLLSQWENCSRTRPRFSHWFRAHITEVEHEPILLTTLFPTFINTNERFMNIQWAFIHNLVRPRVGSERAILWEFQVSNSLRARVHVQKYGAKNQFLRE